MEFCVFFTGIKNKINKLLAETNEFLLEDSDITTEQKKELLKYRKDLRDFLNEDDIQTLKSFAENIKLPTKPSFINIV